MRLIDYASLDGICGRSYTVLYCFSAMRLNVISVCEWKVLLLCYHRSKRNKR